MSPQNRIVIELYVIITCVFERGRYKTDDSLQKTVDRNYGCRIFFLPFKLDIKIGLMSMLYVDMYTYAFARTYINISTLRSACFASFFLSLSIRSV